MPDAVNELILLLNGVGGAQAEASSPHQQRSQNLKPTQPKLRRSAAPASSKLPAEFLGRR
jgi:hypothetical protein